MQEYRNCYIRPSAKNSETDQRDSIAATGPIAGKYAKTIVETGKKGKAQDIDALLKTSRAGELFVVAELQCLGDDLPAVMSALAKIQKRGLVLFEAATGRRFSDCYDGPAAGIAADDYFRRRSLSTMAAKRAGKKGAAARYEATNAGRAPPAVAVRRWNAAVNDGATADEAMAAINEDYSIAWSYDTFLRWARDGKLPGRVKRLPPGAKRKS
jgi:hypothetical protein